VMPFGVMGAHYQPTGQTWLLGNMLDYGLDPQAALDLPRAFFYDGEMQLEAGIPNETADALTAMGHKVVRAEKPHGGGQAIWRDPATGVLTAGSDPRKDGSALGF
ncbi:MAG: gamma-glutamyltransferase, partial [Halofilum sp. (in: g-proteobacteria)]